MASSKSIEKGIEGTGVIVKDERRVSEVHGSERKGR